MIVVFVLGKFKGGASPPALRLLPQQIIDELVVDLCKGHPQRVADVGGVVQIDGRPILNLDVIQTHACIHFSRSMVTGTYTCTPKPSIYSV